MIELRKISKIEKTYKNFRRFEEIIKILFKYGLQDVIKGFDLPVPLDAVVHKIFEDNHSNIQNLSRAERFRKALQELGPTFIKLGQILSLRIEILPSDIIEELSYLQDRVPPCSFEDARAVFREETGTELEDLFTDIDDEPIGSASLGQVYKARLKKEGLPVAVKIQRPDIQEQIEIDLEILLHIAGFVENNIKEFQYYKPTKVLEEFARSLSKELDYKMEEANIERFKDIFKDDDGIHIMNVYPEYSTGRVLTMEHIEGIKAKDLEKLKQYQLDLKLIADRGADSVLKQIFEEGFFHADPHPGNIFIENDNVVAFIDFGMVGRLNRRHRQQMADFLLAISEQNAYKASKILLQISEYDKQPELMTLERGLDELIDRYVNRPLKEVSLSRLFAELGELLAVHRMNLYTDFSMMFKALATLEGLGRSLDPEINLTQKMVPYFKKIKFEKYYPSNMSEDFAEVSGKFFELFKDMPEEIRQIGESFKLGKSKIIVEHQADKAFRRFVNQGVNRLSYALLISALIVSSAILILSGIPPKFYDVPVIGLIGFVIAALMGCRLLISIWKHGTF